MTTALLHGLTKRHRLQLKSHLFGPGVLVLLILLIYVPITQDQINDPLSDYSGHIHSAVEFAGGKLPDAHFLFAMLTAFVYAILPIATYEVAALIVILGCQLVTGLFLYSGFFYPQTDETAAVTTALRIAATVMCMIAYDVALLYFVDGHFYMGGIGLTAYHNPTIQTLKPFALLQFLLVVRILESPVRPSYIFVVLLACVTVLSALAKPTYLVCIAPGAALVVLLSWNTATFVALFFGLWVPAVCVVGWQYFLTYTGPESVGIMWAPLLVFLHFSKLWTLVPRLACGLLFPLVVVGAYPSALRRDRPLQLAWATMLFASAYAYLLAEGPPRTFHGNMTQGQESSAFMLFAASASGVFQRLLAIYGAEVRRFDWRILICLAAFLLHVAFGLAWYFISFGEHEYW